jgi:aminotransferase
MKNKVSSKVSGLPFSIIREMALQAAKYDGVISLSIGEPDFDTHASICRSAMMDALRGATHYTPSKGDPELIEAICKRLEESFDQRFASENIVVTIGGMGALTAYFRSILEPEDEVLVPSPYFPSYRPHIEWAGGRLIEVPTTFENGFKPTADALSSAVTPRTKVLLLNSPNNPTGAVIPGHDLDWIADFVLKHDLLVVSDEVYEKLNYTGRPHQSIFTRREMADRTVVIHSFSKSYAMTGWRIGYAFGPPWIIEPITKVVSYTTSCASSVSQRAALAALRSDPGFLSEMTEEFEARGKLVFEAINRIPGVKVRNSDGAFYLFPDIGHFTSDSYRFAMDLLEKARVAVVPGMAFGSTTKNFIRIAYTIKRELLAEAVERIERFIRKNYF